MNQLTTVQKELKSMLSREDMAAAFKKVLGENAEAFMASILTSVNLDDNLKFCAPDSIINSAMLAASLDLPIEKNLGQAWLIPYNSKEGKRAQFQIGYKGLVQLALRTNEYDTLHAGEIYNGITVKVNPVTGKVDWSGEAISDQVIGYIAYMKLLNGFERATYMTFDEAQAHAKKYSKSFGRTDSPWATHPHEMGKKTVLKRLLTKYGLLSVKMRRAITADETEMDKVDISDLRPAVIEAEPKRQPQSRERNMGELGFSSDRPWSAEHVREKVQGWVLDLNNGKEQTVVSDNAKKVLAAVLDKVTGDKTKRYEICQYLTGIASTANMNTEVVALMNWLGVARFEDVPTDEVRKEIAAVHTAALKEKGQMEMAATA